MDPNAALEALMDAVSRWEDTVGGHEGEHIDAGCGMRDGVRALDGWLRAGGFTPAAWNRSRS